MASQTTLLLKNLEKIKSEISQIKENNIKKVYLKDNIRHIELTSKVRKPSLQGKSGFDKKTKEHFDSIWEFAYFKYQTEILGNICKRNYTYYIEYVNDKGKKSKFYPDFSCCGMFVEVKGIFRESDLLKQTASIGKVEFIDKDGIIPIIKELNLKLPNWKEEFDEDKFCIKHKFGKIKIN